jgi:hypothetical protein
VFWDVQAAYQVGHEIWIGGNVVTSIEGNAIL